MKQPKTKRKAVRAWAVVDIRDGSFIVFPSNSRSAVEHEWARKTKAPEDRLTEFVPRDRRAERVLKAARVVTDARVRFLNPLTPNEYHSACAAESRAVVGLVAAVEAYEKARRK